jgi:outer membrane protein OmpA-like peptidoglycan-associated protein
MNIKSSSGVLLGAALALSGCVSAPKTNAALETARSAVQTAEADPNVSRFAALDLEASKKELEAAENAALHNKQSEIDQPAYLATQTARLAQARAAAKADDARVAAGQVERDQIQLAARAREADNAKRAAEAATAQSARLQAEIDQLKAAQTERGLVLTFGDVLFDTGKAELNPGAKPRLDTLAQFLIAHPNRRVQIDGFTDNVGNDSLNLTLSQHRADAVQSSLLARRIDASRISAQGYGKAFPVASNSDAGGRQLNRRVEVVIGNDDGTVVTSRTR